MNGDPSPVTVDLEELGELGVWLRMESQPLQHTPQHEVHFGQHSPCGETNAARWAILAVLDEHRGRADGHRHEIEAVATALEAAAGRYAHADDTQAAGLRGLVR